MCEYMNVHPKQAEIAASREAISWFFVIVRSKSIDRCSFKGKDKEPSKNILLMLSLLGFFFRITRPSSPAPLDLAHPLPSSPLWKDCIFPAQLSQDGLFDLIWSVKCEWKYDMGHSRAEALRATAWISHLFPLSWDQHVSD